MAQFQELDEAQWTLIQELMGWSPPKERGKPRTNLKRVWNAILYILTHGYKGKGSLLHLLVDGKGACLAMTSTGANGNEREEQALLERVKELAGEREMIVVEADKGYDSAELRQELLNRGFFPLIPWRKNVKGAPTIKEVASQFGLKPIRWVVERTHSWPKRKYRRLMARWERKSEIWDAMTQLALIMEWVKNLLR